eukprot:g1980.t1
MCDGACPKGSYSVTGASTDACTQCEAGRHAPEEGATVCNRTCLKGYYSLKGATNCERCPPGRYGNISGATSKDDCPISPVGRFANGLTVDAVACGLGQYQDTVGSLGCKRCPPGKWGGAEGLTTADCSGQCPAGTFSGLGSPSCTRCEAGKYSSEPGSEVCLQCESFMTSMEGSGNCVCVKDYYMNYNGSCSLCMTGANCSFSGSSLDRLQLEENYWRSSTTSLRVLPCPQEGTCKGGKIVGAFAKNQSNFSNVTCIPGNEGVLCAVCSSSYYRLSSKRGCVKCGSASLSWFYLFSGMLIGFVGIVLLILMNSQGSGGMLRAFINLTQYMTVVLAFGAPWPTLLIVIRQILSGISVDFLNVGGEFEWIGFELLDLSQGLR